MGRMKREDMVSSLVDVLQSGMDRGISRWMVDRVLLAIETLGWKVMTGEEVESKVGDASEGDDRS